MINPIKMDDLNWLAKRPVDSFLNVSKMPNIKKPYKLKQAVVFLEKILRKKYEGINFIWGIWYDTKTFDIFPGIQLNKRNQTKSI